MTRQQQQLQLSTSHTITMSLIIIAETLLCVAIVLKVKYTEIDWVAYMQEVNGYLLGERNYTMLKGDTGPLVYPAGFVHIFTALHAITDGGSNIQLAQWIFMALYLYNLVIVFGIYRQSSLIPWFALPLLMLSKRVHSIFLLRLFNDSVAMLFLYLSIYAMIKDKWRLSAILFSVALSVKMNILLFAPAFALLHLQAQGLLGSIANAILFVTTQILLGYPFLSTYPHEYISRAFEFSRVFFYKWTVNWRMVPEEKFLSNEFAVILLVAHVTLLTVFLILWCKEHSGAWAVIRKSVSRKPQTELSVDYIIRVMFTCNLIGILCARSLHYQFYSWYFHTIPYLLWSAPILPSLVKVALFVVIEYAWNVYPSTALSSTLLLITHSVIVVALILTELKRPSISALQEMKERALAGKSKQKSS